MRGLGGLSLILLVMLAGLIWAVTWGPWRGISLLHPQASSSVPAATPSPQPVAQSTPSHKARSSSSSPKESSPGAPAGASAAEQLPAAPVPPTAPPLPPRFPTAVDVPLGTLGSTVTDNYGPPVARTIGVDEDGRAEIFIYRRNHPDTATVIQLKNGRVVSAVTTAY